MARNKENNKGSSWEGLLRGTLSAINDSYDKAESTYKDAASRYQQAIDGQVPLLQLMQQNIGQKKVVDEESMQRRRNVALLTDSLRTIGQLFNRGIGGNVVGYKPMDVESDIMKKRKEVQAYNDGYDRMAFQTAMQDRQDGLKNRLNGINMDMKIAELQGERGKATQKAVMENAKLQRQAEKDDKSYVLNVRRTNAAEQRARNSGLGDVDKKNYPHPITGQSITKSEAMRLYTDIYGKMLDLDPDNKTGIRLKLGGFGSDVTRLYDNIDNIVNVVRTRMNHPLFEKLLKTDSKPSLGSTSVPNSPLRNESGIGDAVIDKNNQRLKPQFPFQNKK